MDKININRCSYEDLLTLPGVGDKIATQIWHMREDWGALELEDLTQVPHLRVTPQFLDLIEFSEGGSRAIPLGEEVEGEGAQIDDHLERLRRVGKLVNTRPGPKGGEQLIPRDKQDPQRNRSTRTPGDVKEERGSRSPSPWLRGMDRVSLEEGYGEMESAFLEGATPHPRAIDSPYWETPRRRGDGSRTGPGEGRSRPGGGDRARRDSYESRRTP